MRIRRTKDAPVAPQDDIRSPDLKTRDDSPTGRPGVPPADLNRTEARQGEASGRIRWVLGVGLVFAIVMMVVVYLIV
jgi:hypothetical protein